jgi:hypothetical protein
MQLVGGGRPKPPPYGWRCADLVVVSVVVPVVPVVVVVFILVVVLILVVAPASNVVLDDDVTRDGVCGLLRVPVAVGKGGWRVGARR